MLQPRKHFCFNLHLLHHDIQKTLYIFFYISAKHRTSRNNDIGSCCKQCLLVHGTGHLTGGTADACGDHRIAMSAATAACLCTEPVTVSGSECVAKSYPDFWNDFSALKGGAL